MANTPFGSADYMVWISYFDSYIKSILGVSSGSVPEMTTVEIISKIKDLETKLANANSEISSLKSELSTAKSRIDTLEGRVTSLQSYH